MLFSEVLDTEPRNSITQARVLPWSPREQMLRPVFYLSLSDPAQLAVLVNLHSQLAIT